MSSKERKRLVVMEQEDHGKMTLAQGGPKSCFLSYRQAKRVWGRYQWRERRECFGQMVQLDGSHHDWFEERREKAVFRVMVDDATNITYAQFFEGETTRACYDVLEGWGQEYGLPGSLYVDRDSIYRCERVATVAEQVSGQELRVGKKENDREDA